jgi:amino acid transporter
MATVATAAGSSGGGSPDSPGTPGGSRDSLPESFWYSAKRRLLGPPLVNEQLKGERLSKPLALGVLSCDGISSAAYGTEMMLLALLPFFGLAAFNLVLPLTLVILAGIVLVVLSYREVVSVYTRAGGSYVVARENFGPRVAQVAAVALLIDYVVTLAVQTAAGSAAIVSAFPALTTIPVIGPQILLVISVIAIILMAYGNLRGIREAGRAFALPTYLFSGTVVLMILAGLYRELAGGGLRHVPVGHGAVAIGSHSHAGLITFAVIYMLAKAFANGGSSLTGIEAVSNAVSALRPPEGRNARQILVIQGSIVAVLIGGISWLAHVTHATPYTAGVPTILAQEARLIFGPTLVGHILFLAVQAGTAAILFTGGNTSFSGFPFLASFVAEDSFLPRWLTKRGHRLVFSNGIIILAVISLSLLLAVGATVSALIPFYAIGVFTGFTMAGFGMARYHLRTREAGWRRRLVINGCGGGYAALVVVVFAVAKFTEGAWLIVVVFPISVFVLLRLHREYRRESAVLEDLGAGKLPAPAPAVPRRTVLLFVDSYDLATIAALRYAKSLRPHTLRAVHLSIDNARADRLAARWLAAGTSVPMELVDCPDRRLAHAAADLVTGETAEGSVHVTALLPRRSYAALTGRLLHDRTADKMAHSISRIHGAVATIIPFDVRHKTEIMRRQQVLAPMNGSTINGSTMNGRPVGGIATGARTAAHVLPAAARMPVAAPVGGVDAAAAADSLVDYERPGPPAGIDPIGGLPSSGHVTVEGRVHTVQIRPVDRNSVLCCHIVDSTGEITALFYGRRHISGVEPGSRIRLHGTVGAGDNGRLAMINPSYELITAAV